MFFCLDLDRTNNQQANTDNFLDDLGMNTNDFNLGNTIFKVAFLAAGMSCRIDITRRFSCYFRTTIPANQQTNWSRRVDPHANDLVQHRCFLSVLAQRESIFPRLQVSAILFSGLETAEVLILSIECCWDSCKADLSPMSFFICRTSTRRLNVCI